MNLEQARAMFRDEERPICCYACAGRQAEYLEMHFVRGDGFMRWMPLCARCHHYACTLAWRGDPEPTDALVEALVQRGRANQAPYQSEGFLDLSGCTCGWLPPFDRFPKPDFRPCKAKGPFLTRAGYVLRGVSDEEPSA